MRAFQPKTDGLLLSQPADVPPPVVLDAVEEVAKEAIDDNKKNIVLAKLGTRGRGKKIAKKWVDFLRGRPLFEASVPFSVPVCYNYMYMKEIPLIR